MIGNANESRLFWQGIAISALAVSSLLATCRSATQDRKQEELRADVESMRAEVQQLHRELDGSGGI